MPRVSFDKYQGLGNDFIVLRHEDPDTFPVERAKALCDRHFGVGADGVLLVSPPTTAAARARMTVLNADGSRPEMCGNGLRCVALFLARDDGAGPSEFVVDTDAGPRSCLVEMVELEVEPDGGRAASVTTGMGRAQLDGELEVPHGETTERFTRVSMGNPHAIRFGPPVDVARIDELGPAVSSQVPGGVNVEFATLRGPGLIDLVVWERGVGRTLACGTGAAATAVAAALAGHAPFGAPIMVRLPGGPLELRVSREELDVQLRGPARWVFSGWLPSEESAAASAA